MFPDMRAEPDTAASFLTDAFQAVLHRLAVSGRKHLVRRVFVLLHVPVPLDKFHGYQEQLDHVRHFRLHTVAHQPGTSIGIRMDVLVSQFLQIGMGQTAETHENEHIPKSTLPFVTQLDTEQTLQILLREEGTFLVFRTALELLERMLPEPSVVHGLIHQPFHRIDTLEGRGLGKPPNRQHPVIESLDEVHVQRHQRNVFHP